MSLPGGAQGQQCKPKSAGYFTQMTAAADPASSIADLAGIAEPLTATIGDPARGRAVLSNPDTGNCLACHAVPAIGESIPHGTLGPSLGAVARRYTEAQLRQLVADPNALFPGTVMPAYHKTPQFARVPVALKDRTILTAAEVEDVVAYLKTLQ
jgi:sulfur-oxidizing protein SoxX